MIMAERFEDFKVWQRAKELISLIYSLSSDNFARDFGLRDQMRRASISSMSNIAKGFESQTQAMFIQFLGRAKGSAGELRAQLYIALEQGHVTREDFDSAFFLAELCSKKLAKFIQ